MAHRESSTLNLVLFLTILVSLFTGKTPGEEAPGLPGLFTSFVKQEQKLKQAMARAPSAAGRPCHLWKQNLVLV